MRLLTTVCLFAVVFVTAVATAETHVGEAEIDPQLRTYLKARMTEFDQIPNDRKVKLKEIAQHVIDRKSDEQPTRLTFICTHNSRRSQMCQIWAAVAACHYGAKQVETFSGGTEATAFNPRAIAALERAGVKILKVDEGKNPRYDVRFSEKGQAVACCSKIYDTSPNPQAGFCAVMTCSQADKSCPIVKGCALRVSLEYDDPKIADGKPDEAATYDERCRQICREMMYLFSQVKN